MRAMALVVVLWSGAARAQWRTDKVEVGILAVAETLIVLDCLLSLDIKNHPTMYERNPLLGEHPSDRKLLLAGAGAMLGTAALWWALPPRWRNLAPGIVIVVEVPTVTMNAMWGLRIQLP